MANTTMKVRGRSANKLEVDGGVEPFPLAAPLPSSLEAEDGLSPLGAIPLPPDGESPSPPVLGAARRYRVWPYGTLQHDGETYSPGAELMFDPSVAKEIPCLELIPEE